MMDESKIIQKLLEHDARFDDLLTKDGFNQFKNEIMSVLDKQTVILQRMDQERIFTVHRQHEHGTRLDQHDKDIKTIKTVLKMG